MNPCGPPGVLGIWGEWLLIFRELRSTGNYIQGFGEQVHSFVWGFRQGFSLALALGHSPKIVPVVRVLLSSLDSLSQTIFGSAHCTVMHSDAIVFLFYKTIDNWPNFCKRQVGSLNFTP